MSKVSKKKSGGKRIVYVNVPAYDSLRRYTNTNRFVRKHGKKVSRPDGSVSYVKRKDVKYVEHRASIARRKRKQSKKQSKRH